MNLNPQNNLGALREEDMQKLTKLVTDMKEQLKCGPACQKKQKEAELKKKYEKAKNNIKNLENNLEESEKKYYKYAFGNAKYNDLLKKKYEKKSDGIIKKYRKDFDKKMNDIENLERSRMEKEKTVKYLLDLMSKYDKSNENDVIKIEKEIDTNNTAQRRVFYEEGRINVMNYYISWVDLLIKISFYLYVIGFIYYKFYKKTMNIFILIIIWLLVYHKTVNYYWKKIQNKFFN